MFHRDFHSGGGRREVELFREMCELHGLLLFPVFFFFFLASVVSFHVCAGKHSAKETEESSVDVPSSVSVQLSPQIYQTRCYESSHLGLPSLIINSSSSTQAEIQAPFRFPLCYSLETLSGQQKWVIEVELTWFVSLHSGISVWGFLLSNV